MENSNTKQLDRQDKCLVEQLNCGWTAHHAGIARDHGVSESIFVTYIWKWIKHNLKSGKNIQDGKAWTYGSRDYLCKSLPGWTEDQVRLVIKKCVQKGLVLIGRFHENKYDKTNWYTLTDYALNECQIADQNPAILNFSQQLDLASENETLRKRILELESQITQEIPSGKIPQWEKQMVSRGCELIYPDLNEYGNNVQQYIPDRSGRNPQSLNIYKYNNNNPRKEEYIKKVCLIGNSESNELTSKKQTSFNNINDLEHSHPQIEAIDASTPLKGNGDLSTTCAITYSQSAPIDHMLSNSHGCSEEKIKAYAESRRKCGATLTQGAWDKSVKVCLDMVREKTKLTPDEAMDVLIARGDGNTRFDEIFGFALLDKKIEKFEEKALKYEVSRGQDEESVLMDLRRMAADHGIPDSFDLDNILFKLFNHKKNESDLENEQADTFLEEISKKQSKAITYHGEEPAYRQAMQAEQAKIHPQPSKPLSSKDLMANIFQYQHSSEKHQANHQRPVIAPRIDFKDGPPNHTCHGDIDAQNANLKLSWLSRLGIASGSAGM